jgi:hypothetical protein
MEIAKYSFVIPIHQLTEGICIDKVKTEIPNCPQSNYPKQKPAMNL